MTNIKNPPLTGKVALVTGASRGIGRAIVERLAADGATVVVNYRSNAEAAQEVVQEIENAGGTAVAEQADMSQLNEVHRLFDLTTERFGRLDILVNNAGIIAPQPIADATEESFDRVFAVNAKGTFFAIQEAAKRMANGGRIIDITSVNTELYRPGVADYAGSKAAVEQFTKVAAKEPGARNIMVNAVSPGATDTDMMRGNPPEAREQLAQMSPLGRMGEPQDIADVVAFLASDGARWITGQNIQVSGGVA